MKNGLKRIILLTILSLCFLLGFQPTTNPAGADDDTFVSSSTTTTESSTLSATAASDDELWTFTYNTSGTITAATYNGSATSTTISIPSTLGSTTITAIGDNVFSYYQIGVKLTDIDLPDTLKTIGSMAFSFHSLTTTEWNDSTQQYETVSCPGLTSINLKNVTTIGDGAFQNCGLTSVSSTKVTSAGMTAFAYMDSLTSVSLPNLKHLNNQIFAQCNNLTSVTLTNAETLEGQPFWCCRSLERLVLPNLTTITDDNNYQTFGGMISLNYLECPKLTNIDSDAFYPIIDNTEAGQFISSAPLNTVLLPKLTTIFISNYVDELMPEYSAPQQPLFISWYPSESTSSYTITQGITLKTLDLSSLKTYDPSLIDLSKTKGTIEVLKLGATAINSSDFTTSFFDGFTSLKTLYLDSMTSVSNKALFAPLKSTLQTISLAKTTSIPASSFESFTALSTANIPKLTSIPNKAFYKTALTTIDLSNVTSIGSSAFYTCEKLTTVSLSTDESVSISINSYAFYICSKLATINLENVTSIGEYTFFACESLTKITMNKLKTLYTGSQFGNCTQLEEAYFTNLTELGADIGLGLVFENCSALKILSCPKVTALETFISGNTVLHTLDLSSIKSLPTYCLTSFASSLKILTATSATSIFNSEGHSLNEFTALTKVYLNSLQTIDNYCFDGSKSTLTEVYLNNIQCVPLAIFWGFSKLEKVNIDSATLIEDSAFGYTNLSSIYAPACTSFGEGEQVFQNCEALTTANFPKLTSIGAKCFYNCSSLSTISFPKVTSIGASAFEGCSKLETNDDSFPLVTNVASNAFANCTSIIKINLPEATAISGPFSGCTNLEIANLPKVTTMLGPTFTDCTNLTEVYLNSVTSVPSDLFKDCWESIQKVNLSSITTVPAEIFWAAENLTEVDITNAHTIEDQAFGYCTSLSSINLSNVITIGSGAFQRCDSLTSIVTPNATQIGEGAFSECTSLASINLPNITTIDVCTFDGCTSLTSINLPNVSTIENKAFMNCTSLTSINLPNITTINMWAFMDCSNLIDTNKTAKGENYLPATEISNYAFTRTSITTIYLPNIQTLGTNIFNDTLVSVLLGKSLTTYDTTTAAFPTSTIIYGYKYADAVATASTDGESTNYSNAYLYAKKYRNTFVDITLSAELPDTDSVKRDTEDHTISVTANGLDQTYQWYQTTSATNTNGTLIKETTKSSLEIDTSTSGTYYYYVVVTNWDGEETITSNICTVNIYDYRISVSAMGNGSLSAGAYYFENSEGSIYLTSEDSITFTMTPNDGYSIVNIQIDGDDLNRATLESCIDNKTYTFENISDDHSIHVEFDIAYTITINCGANGSITQSLDNITFANITSEMTMTMAQGSNLYLKITPDTGYKINSITIDDTEYTDDSAESLLTNNVYTFANISNNHTISVTFSEITYNLYWESTFGSEHGTVLYTDPDGQSSTAKFPISVTYSDNTIKLTFIPSEGYELDDVCLYDMYLSNGTILNVQDIINNNYTWEFTITQDTILQYSFAPKTNIQYSVEVYIQAVNDMTVHKNTGEKNYTYFTEYSGTGTTGTEIDLSQYYITNSDFDAVDIDKQSFYIDDINSSGLTIVHDPYTIDGSGLTIAYIYYNRNSFELTINYDSEAFDSVTGKGPYLYGKIVTATATTKDSHNWTGWSGEDISDLSIDNTNAETITFTMPAKNIALTANATIKTFNIRIMTGEHYGRGEVYLQGDESKQTYLTFNYGDTPTFELKPNPGYSLKGITLIGNGTTTIKLSDNYYTFEPITTSMYINGVFEPIEVNYTVKHYLQTLDSIRSAEKAYELQESDTQILQGLTESTTTAESKDYAGFHALAIEQKTILGNGSVEIEIHYDRNSYEFTFAIDTGISEISPSVGKHTYYYGETIELSATPKQGYNFSMWQSDQPLLISNIGTTSHNLVIPAMENNSAITLTATSTIQMFTVKVVQGANGTIFPSESKTKEYGSEQTYTFKPSTGYLLETVKIIYTDSGETFASYSDDEAISNILTNGITINFIANYTLTATFKAGNSKYTIKHYIEKLDQNAGLEATDILGEDKIKYSLYEAPILTEGETDTTTNVTAKDITGFKAQDITNVTITADGNAVVNVFYTRNEYTLTLIKSDGISSVSFESQKFKYGKENIAISATLAEGYNFTGWKENDNPSTLVADSGELSTTIISMPDRDVKITATAEKIYYQISISVNGEGTTTPSTGSHLIAYGGNMNISFSPNNGWYLSKLIILYAYKPTTTYTDIDELSDFEQNDYTLSNITSNGEIQVYFSSTTKTYIVKHYIEKLDQTAELTGNDVEYDTIKYSLHSTTEQTGTMGEMTDAEALSINGFGKTSTEIVNATISHENGATTAYIYYSRNEYELTLNKGTGISEVTPSVTTLFKYEQEVSISATVSDGYTWNEWTGDDALIILADLAERINTFFMPADNIEFTATAKIIQYTYNILTPSNGTITPADDKFTNTVDYGTEISLRFTPADGYSLTKITINNTTDNSTIEIKETTELENISANGYTLAITYNCEITAEFKAGQATYKVYHYKQSLTQTDITYDGKHYVLDGEVEELYGTTGENTEASARSYTGFNTPTITQIPINGNGSTKIYIYYNRTEYKLILKKDDGVSSLSHTADSEYKFLFEESVTISAEILEGYTWSGWTVTEGSIEGSGIDLTKQKDNTFTMPASALILTATTNIKTYTITVTQPENGKITSEGYDGSADYTINVNHGSDSPTFTFTPDSASFKLVNILLNGAQIDPSETYQITGVTSSYTLSAVFEENSVKYKVNHYIENLTSTGFNHPNGLWYTLEDDTTEQNGVVGSETDAQAKSYDGYETYEIGKVIIAEPVNGQYTEVNIFYNLKTFTLTISLGDYSSSDVTAYINTTGNPLKSTFKYTQSVSIHAEVLNTTQYSWGKWISSNPSALVDIPNIDSTFSMPASDITLTVSLKPNNITIEASVEGTGGSISTNPTDSVEYGKSIVITITPDTNYRIAKLTINGEDKTSGILNNKYTISSATASKYTIIATFELIMYEVTTSVTNGELTGPAYIIAGGTAEYTLKAKTGYSLTKLTINGEDSDISKLEWENNSTTITLTDIGSNQSIYAEFTPDTQTYYVEHYFEKANTSPAEYELTETDTIEGKTGELTKAQIKSKNGFYSNFDPAKDNPVIPGDESITIKIYYYRITYTLTLISDNPEVTVTGDGQYKFGNSVTINATFNTDKYSWHGWTCTKGNLGNLDAVSYTFEMPAENTTLKANVITNTFSITFETDGNGYIENFENVTQHAGIKYGSSLELKVIPNDESFEISKFTLRNEKTNEETSYLDQLIDNTYILTNITANYTLILEFKTKTYTITTGAITNGSIDPYGVISVEYNKSQEFTLTPHNGYYLSEVTINNEKLSAEEVQKIIDNGSKYTFENVKQNYSISAKFSPINYTITLELSDPNAGTITATTQSGKNVIYYNETININVSLNEGYKITALVVNGTDVGAVTTYEHTVTNDVEVIAYVEKEKLTITPSCGQHGSIIRGDNGSICDGSPIEVPYNESISFEFKPDEGYDVADVKINGISQGKIYAYTFTNITENQTIEVSFEKLILSITATTNGNGSVTPANTQVEYGQSITLTITPNENYGIKSITINNVIQEEITDTIVIDPVIENMEIVVIFARVYTITTMSGEHGSITESTSVIQGGAITINFTPDPGYRVEKVSVNGKSTAIENNSYTLTNVNRNYTICVSFEAITYTIVLAIESGNGNITCEQSLEDVIHGEQRTFTIAPDYGYQIDKIYVNDKLIDLDGDSFTITIDAPISIRAIFIETPDSFLDKLDMNLILMIIGGTLAFIIVIKIFSSIRKKSKAKKQAAKTTYSQEVPYIDAGTYQPGDYRRRPDQNTNSGYRNSYSSNDPNRTNLDEYSKPHQIDPNANQNQTPSSPSPSTPYTDYYGMLQEAKEKYLFRAQQQNNTDQDRNSNQDNNGGNNSNGS